MAQKRIEACLVCGEPLVYYETAREMTCVYCGGTFPSNAACEAGHFVCDACHSRKAVENILAYCGTCESRDPVAIAKALMADPFVHMHGPEHHVLVAVNTIDYHLNPQAALDAPRFQWTGGKHIQLEREVPAHIAQELARLGHEVEIVNSNLHMGRGQIIWRTGNGLYIGGTEPRCDGAIAAW